MGLFSFLGSGGRAAEDTAATIRKVAEGAISGIDALILTDEEEIQYGIKKVELKLRVAESLAKHVENTADENTARSKARRWIAKNVVKVWLSTMLLTMVVYAFDEEKGKGIYEVAEAYWLGEAVMMVLAFYFTLYAIDKVKKGWGKS